MRPGTDEAILGGRYSTEKTLETVYNSLSWRAIGTFEESPNLIPGGFSVPYLTLSDRI